MSNVISIISRQPIIQSPYITSASKPKTFSYALYAPKPRYVTLPAWIIAIPSLNRQCADIQDLGWSLFVKEDGAIICSRQDVLGGMWIGLGDAQNIQAAYTVAVERVRDWACEVVS